MSNLSNGIYNLNELENYWSSNGDLKRNQNILYQAYQSLNCKVNDISCKLKYFNEYQLQVQKNKADISKIKTRVDELVSDYNDLIDALNCRFDDIEKRLSKLEGDTLNAKIKKLQ